jgi:hypothetical protein
MDQSVAESVAMSVSRSVVRIDQAAATQLTREVLEQVERDRLGMLQRDLDSGEWQRSFRGRDVLKDFVGTHLSGELGYAAFRDLVVARMRDESFQPKGMREVVEKVCPPKSREHSPQTSPE